MCILYMLRTKRTFVLNTRHSTRASITRHTSLKRVEKKSSEFFTTAETIARFVGSIDDPTISSWNVGRSFDATIARDSNNNNNNYYYNYDKNNDHGHTQSLRTGCSDRRGRISLSEATVPPSGSGADLAVATIDLGLARAARRKNGDDPRDRYYRVTSRIDGSLVWRTTRDTYGCETRQT